MKRLLFLLILALITTSAIGCMDESHSGRIYVRKPNGKILKYYEVELDRPMSFSVTTEEGAVIEVDSRTQGLFESLTMTLGLQKVSGGSGYYDPYY